MYTYQDLRVRYGVGMEWVCIHTRTSEAGMEWVWSGYVYIPGPRSRVWSGYGVGMYTYQDL